MKCEAPFSLWVSSEVTLYTMILGSFLYGADIYFQSWHILTEVYIQGAGEIVKGPVIKKRELMVSQSVVDWESVVGNNQRVLIRE